ncbi:hypothetical protein BVRB_6g151650 [Beta vulgaris subsp. vulgaris]|nr:hypothetical protein BVRB_6g151650 [Beta vulgaris subsp. vulgaris]
MVQAHSTAVSLCRELRRSFRLNCECLISPRSQIFYRGFGNVLTRQNLKGLSVAWTQEPVRQTALKQHEFGGLF